MGDGDGMGTFPFSLNKNGHAMVTSPFYLKGMGIDTSPFSLKGDGDGHLSILSKEEWSWDGHLFIPSKGRALYKYF